MSVYLRVWQYEVRQEKVDVFTAAYSQDGDWARLFGQGTGFNGTQLYRDVAVQTRFVTMDCWETEEDWRAFRRAWSEVYAVLDSRFEPLSLWQRELMG